MERNVRATPAASFGPDTEGASLPLADAERPLGLGDSLALPLALSRVEPGVEPSDLRDCAWVDSLYIEPPVAVRPALFLDGFRIFSGAAGSSPEARRRTIPPEPEDTSSPLPSSPLESFSTLTSFQSLSHSAAPLLALALPLLVPGDLCRAISMIVAAVPDAPSARCLSRVPMGRGLCRPCVCFSSASGNPPDTARILLSP
mmetsp:Transcript_10470/g.38566  ORF Transcript_10470/g.38566 Transcript_10470/m.38566 type:complete len:201 (+) Transcript_10470:120-722(+)